MQRVDWAQSDRSNWFARFGWQSDYEGDASVFPTQVGHVATSAEQAVLSNTRIFGATTVNEMRLGLNMFEQRPGGILRQ